MPQTLRIATYNVENFYLLLDKEYSKAEYALLSDEQVQGMNHSLYIPNKSLDKIADIAANIQKLDLDLVGLIEVGGMETLRNLNRYYLNDAYDTYLFETNSKRGIFVGALVKKQRFHNVRARNVPGKFSRNLLELRLRCGAVELRVHIVHLKSHFGTENGIEMRALEIEQLCRMLPQHDCIVMGDFNGLAIPGMHQFEFEPLLQLPFRDVLEARGVPPLERVTHFHFMPQPHFNQLDYIFCSNDIQILEADTHARFIPATRDERDWLASDHCMLSAKIRLRYR